MEGQTILGKTKNLPRYYQFGDESNGYVLPESDMTEEYRDLLLNTEIDCELTSPFFLTGDPFHVEDQIMSQSELAGMISDIVYNSLLLYGYIILPLKLTTHQPQNMQQTVVDSRNYVMDLANCIHIIWKEQERNGCEFTIILNSPHKSIPFQAPCERHGHDAFNLDFILKLIDKTKPIVTKMVDKPEFHHFIVDIIKMGHDNGKQYCSKRRQGKLHCNYTVGPV